MASAVLLQGLGNGVIWDALGIPLNGHQVYVYQRGTITQVQVWQDAARTTPLSQPLTSGSGLANPGGIPGYVSGEQALDFYDATLNTRRFAEPVAAADLPALTGSTADDAFAVSAGTGQKLSVGAATWATISPLGSAKRAATDMLMSTYDTSPSSTDQTTAFQNALAAAATLIAAGATKVRIILDSRQTYTIGGAVTAGSNGQYAQVPLPYSNTHAGTIQIVGVPRGNDYSYVGAGGSGTVIESTLASAPTYSSSTGIASIFGGPASFSTAHSPSTPMYPNGFSYIRFATQDITIRSASPVVCGIDCGWVSGFQFDGLLQFDRDDLAAVNPSLIISLGLWGQMNAPCTAPQAIPVIMPFNLDWFGTLGDRLVCSGWLGGPMLGEYAQIRSVTTFYTAGAAVYVDGSNQISRIDYLTDWNNAYGIASTAPGSATPVSPTSPAQASGFVGPAAPIDIGSWGTQISQGGPAPSSTQRVYDVMDANHILFLDAPNWSKTDDANNYPAPVILGTGASATGAAPAVRYRNKYRLVGGVASPSFPASTVPIRNPYGADALVTINDAQGLAGATVVAVSVNAIAQPFFGQVIVPAAATIAVAYIGSGTPTWVWEVL